MVTQTLPARVQFFVDAHVHYHPCFDLAEFLASACRNFQRYFAPTYDSPWVGFLLMADTGPISTLDFLGRQHPEDWRFVATEEDSSSLLAYYRDELRLVFVAGRQIVTAERIEVLALGTAELFDERRSVLETIETVRRSGAVPVLPWGFGKWVFRRGKIVNRLVESLADNDETIQVFVGDNGGRLRWFRPPRQFARATALGLRVLPGSDPLPFPSHAARVGSYGCVLNGEFDPARPATRLIELLMSIEQQPDVRGCLAGPGEFCFNQLAMQTKKLCHR